MLTLSAWGLMLVIRVRKELLVECKLVSRESSMAQGDEFVAIHKLKCHWVMAKPAVLQSRKIGIQS